MSGISLKHLQAFAAVAEQKSFRRAAELLHTTQPNISTRIATLEAQLGARLMDRDAGKIRLTPLGERMLPNATRVLAAFDAFLMSADDDRLFEGSLRLGATEMLVHTWLSTFLTAFKERFANIDIELTVDVSANLSPMLFKRRLDLALQSGPYTRETTGQTDLGAARMIWIAAPSLGLGARDMDADDLAAFPVLTHARGTRPYEQLNAHVDGLNPGRKVRIVPSTNLAACLQMTRDGFGLACLPEPMVATDLESGRLERLRYPWVPDPLEFHARFDADAAPFFVRQAAELAETIAARHRIG